MPSLRLSSLWSTLTLYRPSIGSTSNRRDGIHLHAERGGSFSGDSETKERARLSARYSRHVRAEWRVRSPSAIHECDSYRGVRALTGAGSRDFEFKSTVRSPHASNRSRVSPAGANRDLTSRYGSATICPEAVVGYGST